MDREEFYYYILKNYNLSGEAQRLIYNILSFVEENYPDESKQCRALHDLLDGTIGLTREEINRVYM